MSTPMECLQTSLANSATWQTWTSSDNATEAKGYIKFGEETAGTYPIAVINSDSYARESISLGTGLENGSLFLEFIDLVGVSNDLAAFEANYLACISEIEALNGTAGCLAIRGSEMVGGPIQESSEAAATTDNTMRVGFRVRYWGS